MRVKTNKSSFLNHGWVKVSVFLLSMIFLLTVINMTPITLADAPDGDEKFTIAIIPDTQWETSDPPKIEGEWFKNRTQWLAANKDDLDLRFVLHTGDVTNWPRFDANQLVIASEAMKVLEDANIRYQLSLGNHDTDATGVGGSAVPGEDTSKTVRDTIPFNTTFPVQRFPGMVTYEPNKIDNAYQTFEAEGLKWLVLTLELWPRTQAINWAKDVVKNHPDYNVIIHTHSYLTGSGDIQQNNGGYGANSPQYLFDNLIKQYPNIKFVFSGHTGQANKREDIGVHGNKIVSVLGCFHSNTTNPVQLMEIDVNTGTASTRFYGPLNGNQFTQYRWTFTGLNFVEPSDIEIVSITESARVGIKDGVGITAFNQTEDHIGRREGNEETYAKLYYKADLGSIKIPIISAKLKFNAKAFVANTLSVYEVEEWDQTISFENQPEQLSKIGEASLQASFDGKYIYADREIDITGYVKRLQANNNTKVNIMLDFVHNNTSHPADNRIIIYGVTKVGASPYIEITVRSDEPMFGRITGGVTVDNRITEIGVIDKNNSDANVYETRGSYQDAVGTNTVDGTEYDKRAFYKIDLSEFMDKEIISAELVLTHRLFEWGTTMYVGKVSPDWNMDSISYNNAPDYNPDTDLITSVYYDSSTGLNYVEKTYDITDYVKTLTADNSIASLIVYATPRSGSTRKDNVTEIRSINSGSPPYIRLTTVGEIETFSLTADVTTGSCLVKGGTEEKPMKATPVLVLYKGKAIEKVAIGEQKEIVGNGVVGTEIDLTGITIGENHELRMYVWEDITKLTPVLRKPGVLKPIIQ